MPSEEVLNALEGLHRELERLEPAIKHVETAQEITRTVKTIPDKHLALIEALKQDNNVYKEFLTNLFSTRLAAVSTEVEKLISTTRDIQSEVANDQQSVRKLKEQIASFHDKVERINFPERLDKLDATISGIMAAVQSTQSRLDNIERNLTDRLKELSETQKDVFNSLDGTLSRLASRLSIFHYVTLASLVALVVTYLVKG